MTNLWWKLPGPASLLSRLHFTAESGSNAVLLLQEQGEEDLMQEIRRDISESDGLDWNELDLSREVARSLVSPARFLVEYYDLKIPPRENANVQALVSNERFQGKFIWVDNMLGDNWNKWREFLQAYAHASTQRPVYDRTVFLIPLRGELAFEVPEEDVGLNVLSCNNMVSKLDSLLYASQLLQDVHMSPLKKQVAIYVIAELGLWDREVIERLADLDFADLMRPHSFLQKYANEKGWVAAISEPHMWEKGVCRSIDNFVLAHSAFLSLMSGFD